MRIGLTGSPGTGKKTVGAELSKITGLEPVSLNDFAIRNRIGKWSHGEFVVDIERLGKERLDTRGKIIYGHLLPYVIPSHSLDFVAILRCSPKVLRRRYISRGYSSSKMEENIEAELLDIISFKCLESYRKEKVAEFDTTRSRLPHNVARKVLDTIRGQIPARYGIVSWTRDASRSSKNLRTMLHSME